MSELHIHVDASYLRHDLAGVLGRLGFWRSDFSEQQVDSYAPLHHFTLKPQSTREFKATFNFLVRWLEENPGNIDGYLEGEVVPVDDELAEGQFDSGVPIPFTLG